MHSKNDNIEIMINDKADEVTKERFNLLNTIPGRLFWVI